MSTALTIGFPHETNPADRRSLLTPGLARALTEAGHTVAAQRGIGAHVAISDEDLAEAGAGLVDAQTAWAAPLVLRYRSGPPSDLDRLGPGQAIGAVFHAEGSAAMLDHLRATGIEAYSFEFLHEDGRFPLMAAGGRIAGIQAVLQGAQALQHRAGRGVLLTALPGAEPARVVVIGSGNVGGAAAETAAGLGAAVTVLARTEESARRYRESAPEGCETAVNTPERLRGLLPAADMVIGAILESTWDTPAMITRSDLQLMRPGSVIVDATCGYGPGYLPTCGPVQEPGAPPLLVDGILHVKQDALPMAVPRTASLAYAEAAAPYLVRLAAHVAGETDPVIDTCRIAAAGTLTHPVLERHASLYATGSAHA
jgi:alanine dehydrogenase